MDNRKILLFDLGGVIVRWEGVEALMEMRGMTRDAVIAHMDAQAAFNAYQIGQCDDDVFTESFISAFDLDMSPVAAKTLWQSWVEKTYDGIETALQTLRTDYRIACLSNTNALHWARLEDHIITGDYFDHSYASHLLGAAKPHSDCYHKALADMGAAPQNVVFFDDTAENITVAKDLGMEAHLVDRSVGVIPTLQTLGIYKA